MGTTKIKKKLVYDELINSVRNDSEMILDRYSSSDNRSIGDRVKLLEFFKRIVDKLYPVFLEYDEFLDIFKRDFFDFNILLDRSSIFESIIENDYIVPESEKFYFLSEDGRVEDEILDGHIISFQDWADQAIVNHENTQKEIGELVDIKRSMKDFSCQCMSCFTGFRTKLRNLIFQKGLEIIEEKEARIREFAEQGDVSKSSDSFYTLRKDIEFLLKSAKFKLKRSSINKIDEQLKSIIKEKFKYSSDISQSYLKSLNDSIFIPYLIKENMRRDFVENHEYNKFYAQLGVAIYKNEKFLIKEFKKFIKSLLFLKRQDVSSNILREYLGQFWIHSDARRINRKVIYHLGPTNSGKTYHAIERLASSKSGCYLAPLRLLAGELYDTLNSKNVPTTLLTGEEVVETPGATHFSSTIEMAQLDKVFDCCVIDEIQMLGDSQRGWAWTRAFVNLQTKELHICGDSSVLDLVKQMITLTGDSLEVKNYERMTDLDVYDHPIRVGDLEKGDALIVFSRKNALKYKRDLEQVGLKVSIIYGRLSPEVRREQARKFDKGETDVMVSTDAIAMGVNLPIRRIVFSTLSKFINSKEYIISKSEIKQIAGRAGRYGRFPIGYVTCLTRVDRGIELIKDSISSKLEQKTQAMVGPDLDIFSQVNKALEVNTLPKLNLSDFLRLFNTMTFVKPFFCVELREMIELSEMVEDIDHKNVLSQSEIFGFACSPVNLGLIEHVQYYVLILNNFVAAKDIGNEPIDYQSSDIDYLETGIKCVELFQWIARHFNNKHFNFNESDLIENKLLAVEKLNELLSAKIVQGCASCGAKLPDKHRFNICESCFDDLNKRKRIRGGQASSHSKGKKTIGRGDKKRYSSKNKKKNKKRVQR